MSEFDPYADDVDPYADVEGYETVAPVEREAETESVPAAPSEPKPKRKPSRGKSEKSTILAALAKYDEIRSLDASERSVLATILGSSEDAADITASIATSGKKDTGALGALLDVANASPIRAGILSDKLHRADMATFRAAWALLANYADIDPVVPRRNDVVEIFAENAVGLSESDKQALSAPLGYLEF